jgi:hypothetical protein
MGLLGYFLGRVLDWLGAKDAAAQLFCIAPRSDYAGWWAGVSLLQQGTGGDARALLERLHEAHPEWKRTKRLLATVYLRDEPDQAAALYATPMDTWDELTLGDLLFFFLDRKEEGLSHWRAAYKGVDWKTSRELDNPARLILKRLWRFTRDTSYLEQFAKLDTDNFRQQDIVDYANLLASRGELDQAREMLDRGLYIYRGDSALTACWEKLGFGSLPAYKVRSPGVAAVRHNVQTGLLTEVTDLPTVVKQVHEDYPDGVITIASSVVTMCEGTLLWIPTFHPSRLARLLGPFTGHGAGPVVHWYSYPREAAWKVEAYMELAGTLRVIVGAVATVAGKLVRHKGWFYSVVGPVAKAVDSDKLMPYDACLVPGPLDVQASLERLSSCGAQVAVVDVNDVFGAEIVACTNGVDVEWLRQALGDNPAGNDDSMTPIVVVMPAERFQLRQPMPSSD